MNPFRRVCYTTRDDLDWSGHTRELSAQVVVTKMVMTEESNIQSESQQYRQQKVP
jgi:hypothetical protein